MYISRLVIRNFRNFKHLDVKLHPGVTCIIGENNTGKSNLLWAIRLAVDANLSSRYRQLLEHDIFSGVDLTVADQVLVSVEFQDYKDSLIERALLGFCEVEPNVARIHYRYRPKPEILEQILAGTHDRTHLSITEDYHFQITGGGVTDPSEVPWNEELGSSLKFGHLQAFHVEALPALRDVTHSLRQAYESPLGRVLSVADISDEEKAALVEIMEGANSAIEGQPTIHKTGKSIKESFAATAGEAFQMEVALGMSDPTFGSIIRSLQLLLSNSSLSTFEVSRNGLGLNNVLYISMLLQYFERRAESTRAAGQLLLIEEPEAHLHPELQRVLYNTLASKLFQAIVTTHSTHISSHAPIESYITLTNDGTAATGACVPRDAARLTDAECADLNRYLDATRSTLLYARKVILVEGPAELFLIPVLVKQVMSIDLDRHGISIVPIYGTHFGVYAKLFGPDALNKKCAIVCDGDMDPLALDPAINEDSTLDPHELDVDDNECVGVFQCPVTFERAMTIRGTLKMFRAGVRECKYPNAAASISAAIKILGDKNGTEADKKAALNVCREAILKCAKRCGKARFAQIASKYANLATRVPNYIAAAVSWLVQP